MLWYLISLFVGCISTAIVCAIMNPVLGTIEVDESDTESIKWRFVLRKEVDFSKRKFIVLQVDYKNDISQK